MKHLKPLIAGAILTASVATQPVAASGIPVIDVTNVAHMLKQMAEMKRHYDMYKSQYQNMAARLKNLQGSYDMGTLFDEVNRYSPPKWALALEALESGTLPGDASQMAEFISEYKTKYNMQSGDEIYQHNEENARVYDERTRTTAAALGQSRGAYKNAARRMARIETYMQEIDAATDMKAAQDLQNRILVEVGQAMMEMNRLQAASMQVAATDSAAETHQTKRLKSLMRYRTNNDQGGPH